ncbi:MAG: hypothetical protein SFV21_03230 [Rhodospirillaceae bacterium]|nr:hypothetical protein [Rhodospirillaceae bacterium]
MTEPEALQQAPPGEEIEPELQTTHFNFGARVFQAPGARLYKPDNLDQPVFVVDLGDMKGEIKLPNLRKQFGIADGSHDDALLDIAVKALKFVEDVRPGDRIPNEILDGTASWTVSPRHKHLAKTRLEAQLIAWISGKPVATQTPDQLSQLLASKENKTALRAAFTRAASELGHAPDDHTAVLTRLEMLARELCFIEALREAFNAVPSIGFRMKQAAELYGGDTRMMDTITRVRGLMRRGIQEYQDIFTAVDGRSSEIISAMRTIDKQILFIREQRDLLRFLQMKWTPLVAAWRDLQLGQGQRTADLLARTYRFLATRFDTSKSLMKARKAEEAARMKALQDAAQKQGDKPGDKGKARGPANSP